MFWLHEFGTCSDVCLSYITWHGPPSGRPTASPSRRRALPGGRLRGLSFRLKAFDTQRGGR